MSELSQEELIAFQNDKRAALELLEGEVAALSPDEEHPLQLKMGIEREGHFVDAAGKCLTAADEQLTWYEARTGASALLAKKAEHAARTMRYPVERVYADTAGTYMLEFTTQTLAPSKAVLAAYAIGSEMLHLAQQENIDACFGTMKAPFIEHMHDKKEQAFADYAGEVFRDADKNYLLAGRGQHVNISVWCGDKNLMNEHHMPAHKQGKWINTLPVVAINRAISMLPGMILPSRNGNYWRIAARSTRSIDLIDSASEEKGRCAINMRDSVSEADGMGVIINADKYGRMELRQGAADADPYDVALAAAIPITKACLDYMAIDPVTGKAVLDRKGIPVARTEVMEEKVKRSPMPDSEHLAGLMFNTKDNPNFVFLNELAAKKIIRCEQACKANPSSDDYAQELKNARALENIGTRLHNGYCRQYGLTSKMKYQNLGAVLAT